MAKTSAGVPRTKAIAAKLQAARLPNPQGIAVLAAPSIRILPRRKPLSRLRKGASRFGGSPDVPGTFTWPKRGRRPLTFLAQLDLAELASPELPPSGWLLFFYDAVEQPRGFDVRERAGARVLFVDVPRADLKRMPHPEIIQESYSNAGPYKTCGLEFRPSVQLPDVEDRIAFQATEALESDPDARERYLRVQRRVAGVVEWEIHHHLLGHPQLPQEDLREVCELVTQGVNLHRRNAFETKRAKRLLARAEPWQLLLQLDTDRGAGPGWVWANLGTLTFWMRRDHLAARRFNKAWCFFQT